MRAFITGGAGFIGSHLSKLLIDSGYKVTVLDDLSTGRIENLDSVIDNPNFQFFQGDVRNAELVKALVANADHVYHLAAAVGVQLIIDRPVHTIETNIHGTEVVLEAANEYKKKILIASTSEVYGKNESVPFREDDDMVLGSTRYSRWSYACSKAIDEFLAFAFHHQYGLDVVITRFFNTIGPRQTGQYGMVVPRFVAAALADEPIYIYGTGTQSRCFGWVGDVIGGIKKLMEADNSGGNVYNLGSDEEVTIDQLADRVIALTDSRSEKRFLTYKEAYGRHFDDMLRRVPCLDKVSRTIGYRATMNLDQMLEEIIGYIRTVSSDQ